MSIVVTGIPEPQVSAAALARRKRRRLAGDSFTASGSQCVAPGDEIALKSEWMRRVARANPRLTIDAEGMEPTWQPMDETTLQYSPQ